MKTDLLLLVFVLFNLVFVVKSKAKAQDADDFAEFEFEDENEPPQASRTAKQSVKIVQSPEKDDAFADFDENTNDVNVESKDDQAHPTIIQDNGSASEKLKIKQKFNDDLDSEEFENFIDEEEFEGK
jgi:hypothetical protein